MLGNNETEKRVYLNIAKGKIERTLPNGKKEEYSYIEGYLEDFRSKERTFGRERVKYWYIDMRDSEGLYSIGLPLYSGVLRSIVLSLASEGSLSRSTPIRLETYEKNGYTRVKLYADGVSLDWITKELPPIETISVGGKTIKDETKRDAFIESLIYSIQNNLQGS